ncbi:MAG TPA: porin [Burkholderiaceae bacterium]|nr:porin [Burkholderiaceae bacterium]
MRWTIMLQCDEGAGNVQTAEVLTLERNVEPAFWTLGLHHPEAKLALDRASDSPARRQSARGDVVGLGLGTKREPRRLVVVGARGPARRAPWRRLSWSTWSNREECRTASSRLPGQGDPEAETWGIAYVHPVSKRTNLYATYGQTDKRVAVRSASVQR